MHRNPTCISPLLLAFLGLLGGFSGARGQDVEPTLERAARRLAGEVARVLPALARTPEGLALVARPSVPDAVVGAAARALGEEGFRVVMGPARSGGGDLLEVRVASGPSGGYGRLELQLGDEAGTRLVCLHGHARWVDRREEGDLLVVGPYRRGSREALEAACGLARARLASKPVGKALEDAPDLDPLEAYEQRLFLARSGEGAHAVHRAYLKLVPQEIRMAWLKARAAEVRRSERHALWIRLGLTGLLMVVLGAGYLKADLATRGYLTGTLRVVFGTLLLGGLVACWGLGP